MEDLRQLIENEILPQVLKPLRYVGNEHNVIKKDWASVKLRSLFAFPDIYEVGMSHLGLRILYHLVNEEPDFLMERVFAPWPDMEEALRKKGIQLYGLESYRPLAHYDCIGFTLQYEMSYTNILNMLELGKIPLYTWERGGEFPLIIAGGPCTANPEPLADYIDLFVLGEGEEVLLEIFRVMAAHRGLRGGKQEKRKLLEELACVEGIYVPSFYDPRKGGAGGRVISKRVLPDFDRAYFPLKPIVPYMEVIHDRIMLEVQRGCTRGCRFCQAGMIYRPVRERSSEVLLEQADRLALETGYNEISLTSLSTGDYTCVEPLIKELLARNGERRIGISLPSLRVDAFSVNLAAEIQRVRKTGLTFAPEAGTQRMRDVINKGVTEENLLKAVTAAFEAGWHQIKLYFMIGLPTETFEDLDGIADLAYKVLRTGAQIQKSRGRTKQPKITVSVSSFVPKAHTPFQWEAQDSRELLRRKQQYLKEKIKDKRIVYNYHDVELSFLEAVFAKGSRELGPVLAAARARGCRLDGWSEHFSYEAWRQAFAQAGIDPEMIAYGVKGWDDVLPWDHLSYGVTKEYLWQERRKAYEVAATEDCRFGVCTVCGVCPDLAVKTMLIGGRVKENDR